MNIELTVLVKVDATNWSHEFGLDECDIPADLAKYVRYVVSKGHLASDDQPLMKILRVDSKGQDL